MYIKIILIFFFVLIIFFFMVIDVMNGWLFGMQKCYYDFFLEIDILDKFLCEKNQIFQIVEYIN